MKVERVKESFEQWETFGRHRGGKALHVARTPLSRAGGQTLLLSFFEPTTAFGLNRISADPIGLQKTRAKYMLNGPQLGESNASASVAAAGHVEREPFLCRLVTTYK